MNVFVIPSWYPSTSNPTYGIFIKEQINMMADLRLNWKIGVSTWGQGDREKLLWAKDHFENVSKIKLHRIDQSTENSYGNLTEYYQPALSWTKKFRKGNLREIVRCNELNFQHHVLEHGPPDVIMIQASYPGAIIGSYLSEKYDIPYTVHIRLGGFMFGQLLREVGRMKNELLYSINLADKIVVTTAFQQGELEEWIANMSVIHNPVDISFFKPSNKSGDFIASIGRLEEEKGFDLLIDALEKFPDIRLKIGGTGSEEITLKKRVDLKNLTQRVEFLGELNRKDVLEIVSTCKFLVLPSRYETFGNVILEAISCGKPVVATKCGGPEEILSHQTGILCEPTITGLGSGIAEMIERRNEFDPAKIRMEVEDRFSPTTWMNQLETYIKEIF